MTQAIRTSRLFDTIGRSFFRTKGEILDVGFGKEVRVTHSNTHTRIQTPTNTTRANQCWDSGSKKQLVQKKKPAPASQNCLLGLFFNITITSLSICDQFCEFELKITRCVFKATDMRYGYFFLWSNTGNPDPSFNDNLIIVGNAERNMLQVWIGTFASMRPFGWKDQGRSPDTGTYKCSKMAGVITVSKLALQIPFCRMGNLLRSGPRLKIELFLLLRYPGFIQAKAKKSS